MCSRKAAFRDGVGLLFRLDLQPVLDAAQKTIGVLERALFLVRQQLEVRQDRQHFQRARLLEKGVTCAVQ